ncbi:hypothetical protein DPMN_193433 [Dreissena polymorpha]|uniref:Uncharacterized protein n=1 Tax=Dreissena polymorpha TaxID=45954 RepID=A0A9D3Y0K5_DREPO|nr:hypothetical protein DPMN_193433 [Dreissena polymorpha]
MTSAARALRNGRERTVERMWTVAKKTRVNSECVLTNRLASCATAYLTTPGAYVNMLSISQWTVNGARGRHGRDARSRAGKAFADDIARAMTRNRIMAENHVQEWRLNRQSVPEAGLAQLLLMDNGVRGLHPADVVSRAEKALP